MDESQIKEKLRQFICTQLLQNPAYPLGDDQALITGGLMDSFSLAQIGVFAQLEFGIYIPDQDLTVANMDTLNKMALRIREGMG